METKDNPHIIKTTIDKEDLKPKKILGQDLKKVIDAYEKTPGGNQATSHIIKTTLGDIEDQEISNERGHRYRVPLTKKDNWEHRSEKMCCKTCMFYVPKNVPNVTAPLGRCRRRSPTMNGWPVMFETDWCGDHKLDEKKIE